MDLSTTERMRVLLMGGNQDTGTAFTSDASAALAQLLTSVSAAVESLLDRYVLSGTVRTEYFDISPAQRVFSLRAYPVASITGAWFDTEQAFGTETALTSGTDFANPVLDDGGLFILKVALDTQSDFILPRALKVTYTGGMAATAAAFVTAYPDLAAAVDRQCIHEWKRRNSPGALSEAGLGGTVTVPEVNLLRSVREIINRHRRHALV